MSTNQSTLNPGLHAELKKNHDKKRKEKIKFIICILTTNLFVAIATYELTAPTSEILKPRHQMTEDFIALEVPLQTIIDTALFVDSPYLVTLINRKKEVVIKEAYLKSKSKQEGDLSFYQIEVNQSEVLKLSSHLDQGLMAIPYNSKHSLKTKTESKYEIGL